jgi:hypothetical protein
VHHWMIFSILGRVGGANSRLNFQEHLVCHQQEGEEAGSALTASGSWTSIVSIVIHVPNRRSPQTCLSIYEARNRTLGFFTYSTTEKLNAFLDVSARHRSSQIMSSKCDVVFCLLNPGWVCLPKLCQSFPASSEQ